MAAPAATVRGTPSGIKLTDGYQSLITFASNTTISLWEKTMKPPGADAGEPIDQTTMHNVRYRTSAPRSLVTLTPMTGKCAYDPNVLTAIMTLLGSPDTITQSFRDGSTWAFYGFLKEFTPDELQEGQQPTASFTVVPTNFDHVNRVEAGPTVVSVAGS